MTTTAAADILLILMGMGLRPGGQFHLDGPSPPRPPIHFIFSEAPPADLLEELQDIPDVSIVAD